MSNLSEGIIKKIYIYIYYILVLQLKISFVNVFNIKNFRNLITYNLEINLIIKGNGIQNILSDNFYIEPSEVYVNGFKDITCTKTCNLTEIDNNITLKFSTQLHSFENMFIHLNNIIEVDLSNFDSSLVTTMSSMFKNCSKLVSVSLSNINTNNLRDMSYMFHNCSSLKSINFWGVNTSLVEDMEYLFSDCLNIQSIELSQFDTSKVTNMAYMFHNCSSLKTINFENIITSSVEDMKNLFSGCSNISSIDISQFDTSKVTNMAYMFCDCINLEAINLGNINTSLTENMESFFNKCNRLTTINLSSFDTSKVTTMKEMFSCCYILESINITNFDTSKVVDMHSMFKGLKKIKSIDLTKINTSSVNNLNSFLYVCSELTIIDLSYLDTSKVTDMSFMVAGNANLETINFGNINTSSLRSMNSLFAYCRKIQSIDISMFDTSKVIDMYHVFGCCVNLISINFGNINTSSVKNMGSLFSECHILSSIDLSLFDTSLVTDFHWMFYDCPNLKYLNLSNFNTPTINTMHQIFGKSNSLIYLNLDLFQIGDSCNIEKVFLNISSYVRYCINDNKTKNMLAGNNSIPICSDTCFNETNKKVDLYNNICIESCINHGYKYEYKSICYNECPTNTYSFFGQEENNINVIECFDPLPEGYYIDFDDNTFKKCYNICKYCVGNGNETFNNCKECKKGYSLYINLNNITNCYKTCDKYYYIDEFNNFNCTDNLECPEEYNKLIKEKKKCIDKCENDDTYKYEYNGICYLDCPNNTINNNTHKYICYEPILLTTIFNEYSDSDLLSEKSYSNLITYYFSEYIEQNVVTTINTNYIEYSETITNTNSDYYDTTLIAYKQTEYPKSSLIEYNHTDYSTQFIAPIILINNENITQKLIKPSSSSLSGIIYECEKGDKTNDNCNFVNVKNETVILDIIKENIQSLINQETGKSQVIKGENEVIFQITNAKNEKELLKGESLNNQNLTIIDLGECETKLKKEYHINESDSLIYLKKEKNNTKASEKDIQYEVFEPYNFIKLNMSICDEEKVNVYFPIQLSEETKETYEKMKSLGYDMLDINSPFYQDICIPFKSGNNTDIPLSARKNYIYNNKDSQCQPGCQFSSYLPNSLYINCTCSVIEEKKEEEQKFTGKKIYESFYEILKYANFKILKCHNLIFNKNVFKNNFGNIIILTMFSIYFICMNSYMIKGIEPLKKEIKEINGKAIAKNDDKNKVIINNIKIENKNNNKNSNKNIIYKNKIFSNPKKKKDSKKDNSNKNNKDTKRKKQKSSKKILKKSQSNEALKPNHIKKIVNKSFSISSKSPLEYLIKNENINKLENLNQEKEEEKKLDSFELNELEYEEAIIYDKRTFIKIYWDILCREHKIIFTFFICNDHNLLYIKYARFIFLFATDMAMNVFFFSDESMNKIFLNYGKYNFFQQIPQIIYTTIISQLIEVFLCYLSLTDKHIYQIKNLTKISDKNEILNILKCIKIKLVGFFIFTFVLFTFYWYTVSSFCGIYENTQITFLKDSLLSFLLGILYPIAIYLIPSSLRICALRNGKRNFKCIYKLSDIVPFF